MKADRHLKSKRRDSWTDLRSEIKSISESLAIPRDKFFEINIHAWNDIEKKIWNAFSYNTKAVWLWEKLVVKDYSIRIKNPHLYLNHLIDKKENVWFLINETINGKTKYWGFEGQIEFIQKVIEETCGIDEIIIVSKKFEWILIINHHDTLIVTGQLIDKLIEIEKNNIHL